MVLTRVLLRWGVLAALPILAGCSDVWRGEPDFPAAVLMPTTPDTPPVVKGAIPATCDKLLTDIPPDIVPATQRNACIYAMMALIDRAYYEYRKDLHHTVDVGHAASDIIGIGLGSAGALVGGATTKSILAAASAGVAGARGKIDADILYSKSITLIITQMDADRADWKSRIIAQISDRQKSAGYTMYQAATDLLAYFEAGTRDHALVSLDTHASANLANCQAAVKGAQVAGGVNPDIACGAIPVGVIVPPDIATRRAKMTVFARGLLPPDRRRLADALGVPGQPTDAATRRRLLEQIDAATTTSDLNAIAATIKTLFHQDF